MNDTKLDVGGEKRQSFGAEEVNEVADESSSIDAEAANETASSNNAAGGESTH